MSAGALWSIAALAVATVAAACGSEVSPGSSPADRSEWPT
jgi:hypothetical protein